MAKETDLLRDPLEAAQVRYQEQLQAFTEQYVPKESSRKRNEFARNFGFSPNIFMNDKGTL